MDKISVVALDLDGTVTEGREKIEEQNKQFLSALAKKYRLLIVGAGDCERIISQLDGLCIDVVGNYGMQYARYDKSKGEYVYIKNGSAPIDREDITRRARTVFSLFPHLDIPTEVVQFFPSGCFCIPLLGANASSKSKAKFDPDRKIRKSTFPYVQKMFPEYELYIGGRASFDAAPNGCSKYKALCDYCDLNGIARASVIFCGNDYKKYGNDESVYLSEFNFVTIDDYLTLPDRLSFLL